MTPKFKKDLKKFRHSKNRKKIAKIFLSIENTGTVAQKYKPHKLIGNYKDCMECHILPDLLLIWKPEPRNENIIKLIRIGSHSELFLFYPHHTPPARMMNAGTQTNQKNPIENLLAFFFDLR